MDRYDARRNGDGHAPITAHRGAWSNSNGTSEKPTPISPSTVFRLTKP